MVGLTPLGDYFRERARHRRDLATASPDDVRHVRSAEALVELGATADREIESGGYHASHLLRHHVVDGRFAWPDGQSGRAVSNWGFDAPAGGRDEHEAFLGDLCDLATWDACRHIAAHEGDFDRAAVATIAQRYGVSQDRVHSALDGARYTQLFQVGIPRWHELTPEMRGALEGLDGTWVESGQADRRGDAERPTYVNNVGAGSALEAREIVGGLIDIDPEALGAGVYPRIAGPAAPARGSS